MKKLSGILAFVLMSVPGWGAYLVDDAETGTTTNSNGGSWVTFTDGFSSINFTADAAPAQTGNYCRMLQWTINSGASNQFAGAVTSLNADWTGVDLSAYSGIRFYAKGQGLYEISLATAETQAENNHFSCKVLLSQEWTLYELPFFGFNQTWGTPCTWDPTTIYSVGFATISATGLSGTICIDNIEFYLHAEAHPVPDPNVKILKPKINQLGYLPEGPKYFSVTADSVPIGQAFQILDENREIAYSGTITGQPLNDEASSGERVWKTDFSTFKQPGIFTIRVGERESFPFRISDSVYNNLCRDAFRSFYLIRCGLAEDDPITGVSRPACHTTPATIRGGSDILDATGGWHNAGDMGLFVHETAISISYMLWLWELRHDNFKDFRNNIPESENQLSDLLDEARWGLSWLLKMQKSDGTVYHKADGEPNLFGCIAPDQDPFGRKVSFQKDGLPQTPSTIDAADFTGVMSQAARVFAGIDDDFAGVCLAAANKSWTWVSAHPNVGQTDPYYPDPVSWQEFLWAKAEMARTLNNTNLRNQVSAVIDTATLTHVMWGAPHLFGYMTLYSDPNTSEDLKTMIREKIQSTAGSLLKTINSSGYGVALQSYEYWWESNENVLSRGVLLLFANEITGSKVYRNGALAQLNYILGLNSLDKSFVMDNGSNAMRYPWHWIWLVYGKSIPGWVAGGPNAYPDGADFPLQDLIYKGTPNAKCYADIAECALGSWASNEGETSEVAALAFLSGYFYIGEETVPIISTQQDVGKTDIQVYPVPCAQKNGCKNIRFTGIPFMATISIFNINGSETYRAIETDHDGAVDWNFSNTTEDFQGNYIFTVMNGREKICHGKFSVIQ